MRIKTCTAQVTIHFYSFSYDKGVDFLIKVHFKTGLILYRRNNLATLGASYIYTNLFISFTFSGLPISSGPNPIMCVILWVFTNYTEII